MKTPEITHEKNGERFLIRMEDTTDPSVYLWFEKMRQEIWEDPDDHLAGSRNLACENYMDKGGSLFISVIKCKGNGYGSEPEWAGFSYGFVGVVDKSVGYRRPENLRFYSQFTAVRGSFQGYGLGVAIKTFQRDLVLNLFGIKAMTCTFDPLVAVNSVRNIGYFGMSVLDYREACYADYSGLLNRLDVDSDRFYMLWDLEKSYPPQRQEYSDPAHQIIQVESRVVQGRSGTLELPTAADLDLDRREKILFLEIPWDFYTMLQQTDVTDSKVRSIPVEWRAATRKAFQHYLRNGWQAVDFVRDFSSKKPRGFYVLKFIF